MRIGITCYPTYGGSGAVATELGLELARRGHEVHFISYASPFRLRGAFAERVTFHEVVSADYPLFEQSPYALALAVKQHEVALREELELMHVHYAIPHAATAWLAKQMLKGQRDLKVVTTLHGTDITLVGQDPSYFTITKFSIEQSDRVTAVSQYLRDETYRAFGCTGCDVQVIPNFVSTAEYHPARDASCRRALAPPDHKILTHVSNFRPVKRVRDVVRIFAGVRKVLPATLVLVGDGPDRDAAEQETDRLRLGDDVRFPGHLIHLAEEPDVDPKAQAVRLLLRRVAVRPVPYEHERGGQHLPHAGEDAHHVAHALDGTEVRDVRQDLVVRRGQRAPAGRIAGRMVLRARHEVRDHLDVAAGAAEGAIGLVAQVLRHGGHPIGLLDRELRDGEVRGILPHERDVGAVQRGDELEVALRLEHLLGEPGRRGMRDGVMHVHQLELLAQRDLVLLDGQRERVGRVLEQRIVGGHDLVEGDALGEPAPQPERAGVRDEMDLVAAPRELEPQLGGDGSGAAVGRIAGDANSHETSDVRHQTSARMVHQRPWIMAASSSGGAVASIVQTSSD